jgi:hypothetical protein
LIVSSFFVLFNFLSEISSIFFICIILISSTRSSFLTIFYHRFRRWISLLSNLKWGVMWTLSSRKKDNFYLLSHVYKKTTDNVFSGLNKPKLFGNL